MIQRKFFLPARIIPVLITAACFMQCSYNTNLSVYPAIQGLETSNLYSVRVNGKSVWTEKFRTHMDIEKLPDWFTSEPYTQKQQEIHFANLSGENTLYVHIDVSQEIDTVSIHPLSRKIHPAVEDKSISFTLPGPDKLYIRINDLPPLCLFINPPENEIPSESEKGVRYFGPGVHKPGLMTMHDNETVYISGGSIVYGGIRLDGASNVKIMGRGILDGNFEHRRMVLMKNGNQIEINGITIRNGRSWTNTVINCTNVKYQDVKVISFGPGGDGINPLGSRHFVINNCFLRCTDDCIAIKSPDSTLVVQDIQITNNTMMGFAFSDGTTIGFETNGPVIEDVTVQNCDILMARGGSRVDGHSAFSVICDGPAIIRNVLYDNLRVEPPVLKLFELNITNGTLYGVNPPGHIRDIHLKNIQWESTAPIVISGFDDNHRVQNVVFERCTIEGIPLKSTDNPVFRINPYVVNVSFR